MASNYSMEDDTLDINDAVTFDEGFGEQETSDTLEPARKVRLEIKSAKVRTRYDDESSKENWVKRLAIQYAIGADGVDGSGLNANRRIFMDYIIAFTKGDGIRESEWWTKKARGPAKELITALGFDPKQPPVIDQEFLDGLGGREIVGDIIKREQEQKTDEVNDKGKAVYRKTGEFTNELRNHRSV